MNDFLAFIYEHEFREKNIEKVLNECVAQCDTRHQSVDGLFVLTYLLTYEVSLFQGIINYFSPTKSSKVINIFKGGSMSLGSKLLVSTRDQQFRLVGRDSLPTSKVLLADARL